MILNIIANFNVVGGFFIKPNCIEIEPKIYCDCLKQSFFAYKKEDLEALKEFDLYKVGTYNTDTAEIIPCKEFICHLSDIVLPIIDKKFKDGNGKEDA